MRLDERKEHILDFIVREYINSAVPVSSGRVSKGGQNREFGGSPATIRNIMLELDGEGYLHQPHTSAGRAPTEMGYRYFIDYLMDEGMPSIEIKRDLDLIFDNIADESENIFDSIARAMAKHLKLFSGIGILDEDRIYGHGLSEVLREPEFYTHENAVRFADFTENIYDDLKEFGGANTDMRGFGVVSAIWQDDELGECVIFSAGPQRMNYEKATSVLKYAMEDIISKKNKKQYGRR